MTALTLTAKPSRAAVVLQITGAPDGPLTVTRTDTTGTHSVMLPLYAAPIGGALTLTDTDPALTGALTYTVTDSAGTKTTAALASLGLTGWRVHPIGDPRAIVTPTLILSVNLARATATAHAVIGRPDHVGIYQAAPSLPRGTLVIRCATLAAAQAVAEAAAGRSPLHLRSATLPTLDQWVIAESSRIDPSGSTGWTVTLAAAGADPDQWPDPLTTASWSCGDIAYATCAGAAAAYATCALLAAGPA